MAKEQFSRPWWLETGSEVCSVCGHLYLFETEYRCVDCDGAVCQECVDSTTMVCVPCLKQNETLIEINLEI